MITIRGPNEKTLCYAGNMSTEPRKVYKSTYWYHYIPFSEKMQPVGKIPLMEGYQGIFLRRITL